MAHFQPLQITLLSSTENQLRTISWLSCSIDHDSMTHSLYISGSIWLTWHFLLLFLEHVVVTLLHSSPLQQQLGEVRRRVIFFCVVKQEKGRLFQAVRRMGTGHCTVRKERKCLEESLDRWSGEGRLRSCVFSASIKKVKHYISALLSILDFLSRLMSKTDGKFESSMREKNEVLCIIGMEGRIVKVTSVQIQRWGKMLRDMLFKLQSQSLQGLKFKLNLRILYAVERQICGRKPWRSCMKELFFFFILWMTRNS